jgi:hypothetical protein
MSTFNAFNFEEVEESIEDLPVVDTRHHIWHAERAHHRQADQEAFTIGPNARLTDDVYVALHELSKSPSPRLLCTPDRRDLIATKWHLKVSMLGYDASQGYGEVISKGHRASAVILEAVKELVTLVSVFAEQDIGVLQRRCGQGSEPEGLEHFRDLTQNLLSREVALREIIPEAL